jgi:hypothetical protein
MQRPRPLEVLSSLWLRVEVENGIVILMGVFKPTIETSWSLFDRVKDTKEDKGVCSST